MVHACRAKTERRWDGVRPLVFRSLRVCALPCCSPHVSLCCRCVLLPPGALLCVPPAERARRVDQRRRHKAGKQQACKDGQRGGQSGDTNTHTQASKASTKGKDTKAQARSGQGGRHTVHGPGPLIRGAAKHTQRAGGTHTRTHRGEEQQEKGGDWAALGELACRDTVAHCLVSLRLSSVHESSPSPSLSRCPPQRPPLLSLCPTPNAHPLVIPGLASWKAVQSGASVVSGAPRMPHRIHLVADVTCTQLLSLVAHSLVCLLQRIDHGRTKRMARHPDASDKVRACEITQHMAVAAAVTLAA